MPGCTDDLCCSDFKAGADLSGVDFEADAKFDAWIQAVADFSGVANATLTDVTASCKALATELGDTATQDSPEPSENVKVWCAAAVAQIQALGTIEVNVQPAECSASFSAQAKCEGSCQVDASCDPGTVEARCDPGELSVKCEGMCTAKCEGSANLAVTCEGQCGGTCEGDCMGTCSAMGPGGDCAGSCDGTCSGKCRGSCTMEGNAMVECEGECTGGCDGTATAPKCKGEITPPSCEADAECNASCEASAEAKAECKPPSVEITVAGGASAQAIGALKLHLPNIFLAAEARAEALVAAGQAVFDLSLSLDPGSLGGKAALCVLPAADAIGTSFANIQATAEASISVTASVGG
jgi:hypothetical protein